VPVADDVEPVLIGEVLTGPVIEDLVNEPDPMAEPASATAAAGQAEPMAEDEAEIGQFIDLDSPEQPDHTVRYIIIAVIVLVFLLCCCCLLFISALFASGIMNDISREFGVFLQMGAAVGLV